MPRKPIIAITMGDAAGIGPEVLVKALAEPKVNELCRPLVVGKAWVVERDLKFTRAPLKVRRVDAPSEAEADANTVDVLDVGDLKSEDVTMGRVSAAAGKASVQMIEKAARLAMERRISAMTTCPISKEALHLAGVQEMGHQEILGRIGGSRDVATMLMTRGLRVVHLSTHKPLAEAVRHVTKENVLARIKLTAESFSRWGMDRARIAVAAINPHGGEGGLIGREEIEQIAPAVEAAKAAGIDARGPFPADSVFYRAAGGEFDVVLAMYHDQGHIAIKTLDFESSVTVNLGLPFIRTSVDHGTAYDIAGKGVAKHRGLVKAIEAAVHLTTRRISATAT
ncbi:MAG: 4-hydroxythreonine-4-phosphate dehydrogenase PdxA [Chloroflexi bacterium]|nr:4-hydroxythreonine-4-phosphate dehydrogenase PdxA [Chloroflexota bacterium]